MSRTRWLVFDDDHPSITYEGNWFVYDGNFAGLGVYGPTFGSQHGINGTGRVTFPFTGSRVRLYGTTDITNSSTGVIDPQYECFVDGVSIGATEPWRTHQNNWPLCETFNQTFGQHTLTVEVRSRGRTFWVDSIRYLPLANMTGQIDHPTVLIDQTDPAIAYTSGSWTSAESDEAMLTLQTGATMSIDFTGTKLTWMGWTPSGYPSGPSRATYTIDDFEPITFELNGLVTGSATQYFQKYFETTTLTQGRHTLTVTHEGASTPLVLDFLLVEDGDLLYPNASSITPTGGPSSTATSGNANNTANPNRAGSSSRTPVGAIVGGVIGGLALIALAGLAFFFFKRRNQNRPSTQYLAPSAPPAPSMATYQPVPTFNSYPSSPQQQQSAFPASPQSTGNANTHGTGNSWSGSPPPAAYGDGSEGQAALSVSQTFAPLRRNPDTQSLVPPSIMSESSSTSGGGVSYVGPGLNMLYNNSGPMVQQGIQQQPNQGGRPVIPPYPQL